MGCLFERKSSIPFDNQTIKILLEKGLHRFRQIAHDVHLHIVEPIENGKCPIFEYRVGVNR